MFSASAAWPGGFLTERQEVRLELMGRPYAQAPFKYQAKCLDWLRQEYARLPADARARLATPLERSGCLAHLA